MTQATTPEAGPANAGSASLSATPRQLSAFPAPIYRDTVLVQIFEDAKRFFLEPLLAIQYAHTLMLAKQGIMTRPEAAECLHALDSLDLDEIRSRLVRWQL